MNPMEKALAGRKDKILTITISAGEPEEGAAHEAAESAEFEKGEMEEAKEMAPKVVEPMSDEHPVEAKEIEDMKAQMMGSMSDGDKEDLKNRKPRSLMERAQQAALKK